MRYRITGLAALVAALWAAAALVWMSTPAQTAPPPPAWASPVVLVDVDVVDVDQADVAAVVAGLAADPRGWRTDLDHLTLRIVTPGTDGTEPMPGTIGRALPGTTVAVVTSQAWTQLGPRTEAVGATLDDQRTWIVLHELGHKLGHKHGAECPAPDAPAPVMRPVVYQFGECEFNVWPHP